MGVGERVLGEGDGSSVAAPEAALEDVFWLPNSPKPVAKLSIMALMQMKDCVYTKDRASV